MSSKYGIDINILIGWFILTCIVFLALVQIERIELFEVKRWMKSLSTFVFVFFGIILIFVILSMNNGKYDYVKTFEEELIIKSDVYVEGSEVKFIAESKFGIENINCDISDVSIIETDDSIVTITKYDAYVGYNNDIANKLFNPTISYEKEKIHLQIKSNNVIFK